MGKARIKRTDNDDEDDDDNNNHNNNNNNSSNKQSAFYIRYQLMSKGQAVTDSRQGVVAKHSHCTETY
jgi:hypothetical protein